MIIVIIHEYIIFDDVIILQHVSPGGHPLATQATVINISLLSNLGMHQGISVRQLHPLEN